MAAVVASLRSILFSQSHSMFLTLSVVLCFCVCVCVSVLFLCLCSVLLSFWVCVLLCCVFVLCSVVLCFWVCVLFCCVFFSPFVYHSIFPLSLLHGNSKSDEETEKQNGCHLSFIDFNFTDISASKSIKCQYIHQLGMYNGSRLS